MFTSEFSVLKALFRRLSLGKVFFSGILILALSACSTPTAVRPQLEPSSNQTRVLSKFNWKYLRTERSIESEGERSLVLVEPVRGENRNILLRYGLIAFEVSVTREQVSSLSDSKIATVALELDGKPISALSPERVAKRIEAKTKPPNIGHGLLDFLFILASAGAAPGSYNSDTFAGRYWQARNMIADLRYGPEGLQVATPGQLLSHRIYIELPDIRADVFKTLTITTNVDGDVHPISFCIATWEQFTTDFL